VAPNIDGRAKPPLSCWLGLHPRRTAPRIANCRVARTLRAWK
jgi:hypothetical protein